MVEAMVHIDPEAIWKECEEEQAKEEEEAETKIENALTYAESLPLKSTPTSSDSDDDSGKVKKKKRKPRGPMSQESKEQRRETKEKRDLEALETFGRAIVKGFKKLNELKGIRDSIEAKTWDMETFHFIQTTDQHRAISSMLHGDAKGMFPWEWTRRVTPVRKRACWARWWNAFIRIQEQEFAAARLENAKRSERPCHVYIESGKKCPRKSYQEHGFCEEHVAASEICSGRCGGKQWVSTRKLLCGPCLEVKVGVTKTMTVQTKRNLDLEYQKAMGFL